MVFTINVGMSDSCTMTLRFEKRKDFPVESGAWHSCQYPPKEKGDSHGLWEALLVYHQMYKFLST